MDEEDLRRERVLQLHEARIGKLLRNVEALSQPPAPPLHKLQSIGVVDLTPGKRHTGYVLFGRLCSEAFKRQGIHAVVEDASERAILLSIYNVAVSTTSAELVRQRFPIGMKVAIKEPLLKREKGGFLVIRVDNFLNIERVHELPGELVAPGPVDEHTLKTLGNKKFSAGDYAGAVEDYTRYIEKQNPDVSAVGYSNRAEALIRLGNFEQALTDCNTVLKVDQNNVKCLCRKARALHGLHEYELALTCIKRAAELSPSEDTLSDMVHQCDVSVHQSRRGHFDIEEFITGGVKSELAPSCADYVGPIGIRKSSVPGAGRGLFANTCIKPGELIMVSNPVAVVYNDSASNDTLQEDLVTSVMAALLCSRKYLHQLTALTTTTKVPSIDLFKPNTKSYQETFDMGNHELRIDPERIRKVVKDNAFGQFLFHKLGKMCDNADMVMSSKSCGLWLLPAFINHSCLPNAARLEVGKAMFIHAAREICAGEEIFLPYFDTMAPLGTREEMLERWGFQCTCHRCTLERGFQKYCRTPYTEIALRKLSNPFKALHERAYREINAAAEAGHDIPGSLPDCAEFAQVAINLEASRMPPVYAVWLRTSYALAYLAGLASEEFYDDANTKLPTAEHLLTSFHESVPGHWRTLIMQSVELVKLREHIDPEKFEGGMAKEFAYQVCRSTFGNQRVEVYEAIISLAAKLRPF